MEEENSWNLEDELFSILAKNYSDEVFEEKLNEFLQKGKNINFIRGNETVLDPANNFFPSKAEILRRYEAKTAAELGHVPNNLGAAIPEAFAEEMTLFAPSMQFSHSLGGALTSLIDYLVAFPPSFGEPIPGVIFVPHQIQAYSAFMGLLTASEEGVGTAFLISPNIVMVSRHALNGVMLDDLEVKFEVLDKTVKVIGLLEDGAAAQLDYAVLQIDTQLCDLPFFIPRLSITRQPLLATFIGYNSDENLHFTNFTPTPETNEPIGSHQESYQQTDFGISGSPYLDENSCVYALHQNTGFHKKESLYVATILEKNPSSILQFFVVGAPFLKLIPTDGPFPDFHISAEMQFDEGAARGKTLGKNPSVAKDALGNKNIVCQEVLFRWATKAVPKAKYIGTEADPRKWIGDSGNWEVMVRKADGAEREPVKLEPGKIQMGHKLSAVSYWVYGYDVKRNVILSQFFAGYKEPKKSAKITKYNQRYVNYTKPGFRWLEGNAPDGLTNRMFMNDHRNYCFEWSKLNEHHGREEKKVVQYEKSMKDEGATIKFGDCRDLRKDDATTPHIKADLAQREAALAQKIATDYAKFQKGPFPKK